MRTRRIPTLLLAAACGAALVFTLPAAPASATDADDYEQAFFTAGDQQSFTVPANASDVRITAAGEQGLSRSADAQYGGAGGIVTVDLGTAYNGRTLGVLVTEDGGPFGLGAGAAFVATEDAFVVVAGGGGYSGSSTASESILRGGDGGWADGAPDGGDGEQYASTFFSGFGAIGATAGETGYRIDGWAISYDASPLGTAATVSDGTITPGIPRGASTSVATRGPGGFGYAGGGAGQRGITTALPRTIVDGAGGGGSGYAAPDVTVLSTGRNFSETERLAASVTITWAIGDSDETTQVISADSDEPAGLVGTGSTMTPLVAAMLLVAWGGAALALSRAGRRRRAG